ncbi:type II toxin-antitoxin system VapC family toxin [Longimicrobium sp.]|uniref:type II toxin-antitoxin system VapC family toxin n=1 Tax=Longimicrobium sp. TaxID=2029185 RepID=UPI002F9373BC
MISYLAALPSRDPITARNQQITREWWDTRRGEHILLASPTVLDEAALGDAEFARRRRSYLDGVPLLQVTGEVEVLAEVLLRQVPLPSHARSDALHVAVASVYGVAYVLTWDRKHIANPRLVPRFQRFCGDLGYTAPLLTTPASMMER